VAYAYRLRFVLALSEESGAILLCKSKSKPRES
jgi:hypothetical protein